MKINCKQKIELAQIIEQYGEEFISKHRLCPDQLKAMKAIRSCRTSALGGHVDECDKCGHQKIAYNSCRNRHCNKCQYLKQVVWIDKLKSNLPVCRYFHLVFTLPAQLHKLVYLNQRCCYDILFKATAHTLNKVAANPKYLGAYTGAVSILHTWGQSLTYHPHIHMIVPAGGISEDHTEWIASQKKFFLPVRVLSKIYRGVVWSMLKKEIERKRIKLPDGQSVEHLKAQVYQKEWNVYAKKSMAGATSVVQYLGRYTHRVAISNDRISHLKDRRVSFKWKNYKRMLTNQVITLDVMEFIGRFVRHILPTGFYKIRYSGLLASANTKLMEICRQLIGKQPHIAILDQLNSLEVLSIITGKDPRCCPKCQTGILKHKTLIEPG